MKQYMHESSCYLADYLYGQYPWLDSVGQLCCSNHDPKKNKARVGHKALESKKTHVQIDPSAWTLNFLSDDRGPTEVMKTFYMRNLP